MSLNWDKYMCKKFIFIFIVSIISINNIWAQKTEEVLYLKSGAVYRGKIVAEDSVSIKIQIKGGTILVASVNDIESRAVEEQFNDKGDITINQKGFWFYTGLGFPIGSDVNDFTSIGVSISGALMYQYIPSIGVGLGTAIDHYQWEATFLPIFVKVYGDIIPGNKALIYFSDIGYSFNMGYDEYKNYKGGALFNAGLGLKFNRRSRVHFDLTIGYKLQFDKTNINYPWDPTGEFTEFRQFSRTELKFSIGF